METICPKKVIPTESYEYWEDLETMEWLNSQDPISIPGIDIAVDPLTNEHYIIDGHHRQIHALKHQYNLNIANKITSEKDFQQARNVEIFRNYSSFQDLLKVKRQGSKKPPIY